MAKNNNLTDFMVSVANAIRTKKGTSGAINPQNFDSEILSIEGMPSSTKALANVISGEVATDETTLNNAIAKGATDTPETATFAERTTADGGTIKDTIAFVDKVKGNCVKYNQQVRNGNFVNADIWTKRRSTFLVENNTISCTCSAAGEFGIVQTINLVEGHKYLVLASVMSTKNFVVALAGDYYTHTKVDNAYVNVARIRTAPSSGTKNLEIEITSASVGDTINVKRVMVIDLTAIYGSGNEPTSADTFANLMGYSSANDMPYFATQSETIVLTNSKNSVTSKSRNLWDEQWEQGEISSVDGSNAENITNIRSKNYIPCTYGKTYYIVCSSAIRLRFYDANHQYLGYSGQVTATGSFSPTYSNCAYVRFQTYGSDYGTIYKNDICIEDGSEGHGYAPYGVLDNLPTNARNLTDSEGSTIFPNGLCSVGDVHDEWDMAKGTAIRRIGVVKLKDMAWTYYGIYAGHKHYYFDNLRGIVKDSSSASIYTMCVGYQSVPNSQIVSIGDKCLRVRTADGSIYFTDDDYNYAEAFKNHFTDNDLLFYQLAEPITYNVPPQKAYYKVSQNGKEIANSTELSAPFKADIAYRGMSAEDLINELNG